MVTNRIIFEGVGHKKFFDENLARCIQQDRWHKALIYALGITENIRNHFDEVYDIENDCINRNSVKAGWVTGLDVRVMRLAFLLFTDYVPKEEEEKYRLFYLLSYGALPFLLQAIDIRFA